MTEFFFLVKPNDSKVLCVRCTCGRNQVVSGATVMCNGCGVVHDVSTDTSAMPVKQSGWTTSGVIG